MHCEAVQSLKLWVCFVLSVFSPACYLKPFSFCLFILITLFEWLNSFCAFFPSSPNFTFLTPFCLLFPLAHLAHHRPLFPLALILFQSSPVSLPSLFFLRIFLSPSSSSLICALPVSSLYFLSFLFPLRQSPSCALPSPLPPPLFSAIAQKLTQHTAREKGAQVRAVPHVAHDKHGERVGKEKTRV